LCFALAQALLFQPLSLSPCAPFQVVVGLRPCIYCGQGHLCVGWALVLEVGDDSFNLSLSLSLTSSHMCSLVSTRKTTITSNKKTRRARVRGGWGWRHSRWPRLLSFRSLQGEGVGGVGGLPLLLLLPLLPLSCCVFVYIPEAFVPSSHYYLG
jgi:hypothetical protein